MIENYKGNYKKIRTILVYGKKKCIYMKPKGTREYVKSKGEYVLLSVYAKRVEKMAAEKLVKNKNGKNKLRGSEDKRTNYVKKNIVDNSVILKKQKRTKRSGGVYSEYAIKTDGKVVGYNPTKKKWFKLGKNDIAILGDLQYVIEKTNDGVVMQQAFQNGIRNEKGAVSIIPNAKSVFKNTVVVADSGFDDNGIFVPSPHNKRVTSQIVQENIKKLEELYENNRQMDEHLTSIYCNDKKDKKDKKYMC